ncbi:hypothetical protein FNV43_RR17942 [Rhamnella rubrinervis]|uniref:Uncharacterized protein n=1 Tax=Rhamnella rubrinervis TaxID=2594499 RepID=A0A8K0E4S7_9ROSA|nr:hypothetical protein FNV43_RR17942 [Rhamnella rubrinervis]
MGRRPCCEKEGISRGAWSAEEDSILLNHIQTHGQGKWRDVSHRAGLKQCGKSCRLRWLNYLRPDIKRGNITIEEEDLILRLHKLLGNRWSLIAGRLPGRTDNEIKNYWNTYLSKRLAQVNKFQDYSSTKQLGESKVMNNSGTSTNSQTVIRTKAFRCTKVSIPNCLLDHDGDHRIQMAADKNILLGTDPSSSSSHLQHNNYDNYSSEFLNDFNIDDLLMSDVLLNSDSCQPSNLGTFNDCDDHGRVIGVDDGDQNGLKQYVSFDDFDDFPLLSCRHDDDDDLTVHFDDLLTHHTMSSDNWMDVTCYDPFQPNDQGLINHHQ